MNPAPTVTVSCGYLVELSDDGNLPDQSEPEVITLPPAPNGAAPLSTTASTPG